MYFLITVNVAFYLNMNIKCLTRMKIAMYKIKKTLVYFFHKIERKMFLFAERKDIVFDALSEENNVFLGVRE